ncbi:hypothetical protein ABIE27_002123, partial [Paenibacillus sp. 4624]
FDLFLYLFLIFQFFHPIHSRFLIHCKSVPITLLCSRRPTTLSPKGGRDAIRWCGCVRLIQLPRTLKCLSESSSYSGRTEGECPMREHGVSRCLCLLRKTYTSLFSTHISILYQSSKFICFLSTSFYLNLCQLQFEVAWL